MLRFVAVAAVLAVAGCAAKPEPCPEGQARDNAGTCVAIAVPTQSLEDFDPFPQAVPAPSKDEFIATGITPEAQAQIDAANAKIEARRAADDAAWEANKRTDRIVEAQRETQRAVQELRDEVRR